MCRTIAIVLAGLRVTSTNDVVIEEVAVVVDVVAAVFVDNPLEEIRRTDDPDNDDDN